MHSTPLNTSPEPQVETRPTVLSCFQPTGQFTLGNYLGAAKNWVPLLDKYECFFGLVDMHAITVPQEPARLRHASLDCLAQYIACGLDPQRCNLFIQSHVVGHTELAWVLGCLTPVGQLMRMTQFKDKSAKQDNFISSGLLFYPVLQAADILLYNAHFVPVGEDQKQHLELVRDVAIRFNQTFSETFNIPEPLIPKEGARIMSLQSPQSKMSKSDSNPHSTLFILDEPAVIRKKIMSAVTDTGSEVCAAADKPGISNLLTILSIATGQSVAELEQHFIGKGYSIFKEAVADAVIALLEPIQKRYHEVREDKGYLTQVLSQGAEVAQKRAYKMLSKVYRKIGFLERPR